MANSRSKSGATPPPTTAAAVAAGSGSSRPASSGPLAPASIEAGLLSRASELLPTLSAARSAGELVEATRDALEAMLGTASGVTLRSSSQESGDGLLFAHAPARLDVPVDGSLTATLPVGASGRSEATVFIAVDGNGAIESASARFVVDLIARHTATCAELILVRERMERASREAGALYRAATLLVDARDLDGLVENILDAIDEQFGHPICSIYLMRNGALELVGCRGRELPDGYRRLPLDGPGVSVRAARLGRLANVPDVALDGDYLDAISDTRSELAVPLSVDGETFGVINLESPTDRAFDRQDERLLSSFADQAARAIRSARLADEVRRKARREALINEIVTAVNRTRDLEEMFEIFCARLSEATGAERTYIATIDWHARLARFVHAHSSDGGPVFCGSFPLSALPELSDRLWHGEYVAVSDVGADPVVGAARASYARFGTAAVLYVPVVRSGDWAAVLTLCANSVREWTIDEVSIARTVGEQVGTAILQAELFNEVNTARRQWETTFDTMSDGVLLIGTDSRVTRANAAATSLLRMARPDLLGLTCCEALGSVTDDSCPVHEALASRDCLVIQPTPKRIGRPTLVTVDPVAEGGGAVVVLRDLSELRRAEAEARRQHGIVEQLTRGTADLIAMIDNDGTAVWYNAAFATAVELPQEGAAPPRDVASCVPARAREVFRAELGRALEGEPRFFETAVVGREAGETLVMLSLTPVFDDRAVTGVLFVGRDVTAQRRASERAAEADKLRALGQLSSGVAHNFNNALAVILGRTQLLKRRLGDSPLARDLDVIERVSHEASSTVKRIQNFARKRRQESFASVDVAVLLADTLDITSIRWRADSHARGVRYDVTLDAAPGNYTVLGDAAELREVFLNVIFNALDAMPEGGALRASLAVRGGFVEARITDSGHGMTEEVRRRVFEPFFTTKDASGTGLGLAVSYGIISRHDGRIEFESEAGAGTTFVISLPASRTREAAATVEREATPAAPAAEGATVLVVEDNETVREVVFDMLADRGFSVRKASDGQQALALLQIMPADIVVTDLAMPGIDGAALAARIREAWPETRVVLVTGGDVEEVGAGSGPLPDVVLQKPFTLEDLSAAVEALAMSRAPSSSARLSTPTRPS